jgi:N-acetylmuramoyl-L-alanine amidase
VLHADASPAEEATLSWVCAHESQVSYHVLIGRDGTLYRIVPDHGRAWAVGVSEWRGVKDVNSCSLSVALANRQDGREAITDAQRTALRALVAEWRALYPIEEITTHKIVARPVGRKHDPEAAPNFHLEEYLP